MDWEWKTGNPSIEISRWDLNFRVADEPPLKLWEVGRDTASDKTAAYLSEESSALAMRSELSLEPNMKIFAVIRRHGAAWQSSASLEGQQEWVAHARFMNDLAAKGAVVLGGPLEGTPDVLLVMRAGSVEEAADYLHDDPWTALDLLVIEKITPWALRLGALPSPPGSQ